MYYNYSKLKGKIKEKYDTQTEFAKAMELSETSIGNKLNNKVPFSQHEIFKAIKLLDISSEEVQAIFFTEFVQNS